MRALAFLALFLLSGCDLYYEAMEMPNPGKIRAESKAVGAACRHAGRSLEDCYYLNPDLDKAAIFEGWKEMNEYMLSKELPTVPSHLVPLPQSGSALPQAPATGSDEKAASDANSPAAAPAAAPAPGQGAPATAARPLPRNEPIIPNPQQGQARRP